MKGNHSEPKIFDFLSTLFLNHERGNKIDFRVGTVASDIVNHFHELISSADEVINQYP